MSTPNMKICKACKIEKPHSEYYIAVRDNYNRLHPRCKPCHSAFGRTYRKPRAKSTKLKGFAAQPDEVRAGIIEMVNNNVKYNVIAKKYNIVYSTLLDWKKKGRIMESENIQRPT